MAHNKHTKALTPVAKANKTISSSQWSEMNLKRQIKSAKHHSYASVIVKISLIMLVFASQLVCLLKVGEGIDRKMFSGIGFAFFLVMLITAFFDTFRFFPTRKRESHS